MLALVGAFFAAVVLAVVAGALPSLVLTAYLVVSFVAFILYWIDKSAARHGRWRAPERTLHVVGLFGGWPGSLIAMTVFRHKSSKAPFQRAFWITVAVNCAALLWFGTTGGKLW